MFTGLIQGMGQIVARHDRQELVRLTLHAPFQGADLLEGASVAHDGVCLTAVDVRPQERGCLYDVDLYHETLTRTTAQNWQSGQWVNLERSLRAGDELGGHLVSGHVDGVGQIVRRRTQGDVSHFDVRVPDPLLRFIAEKGSVALDGTSLTVNHVLEDGCSLTLIPHTLKMTTWGRKQAGDAVNVEVDMLARYASRLLEFRGS
jgi:riboflavin synthase